MTQVAGREFVVEKGSRRADALRAKRRLAVAVLVTLVSPLLSAEAQEPTALDAALTLEKTVTEAIARAEKSVVAIARYRKGRLPPAQGGTQPAALAPAGPAVWKKRRPTNTRPAW